MLWHGYTTTYTIVNYECSLKDLQTPVVQSSCCRQCVIVAATVLLLQLLGCCCSCWVIVAAAESLLQLLCCFCSCCVVVAAVVLFLQLLLCCCYSCCVVVTATAKLCIPFIVAKVSFIKLILILCLLKDLPLSSPFHHQRAKFVAHFLKIPKIRNLHNF